MSFLDVPDKNPQHLFPLFNGKLQAIITEANRELKNADGSAKFSGVKMFRLFEGYRSQLRQTRLYAQGRKRPGPIVTYDPIAHVHGFGLAADVVWIGMDGSENWGNKEDIDQDQGIWQLLNHCAHLNDCVTGLDWKGADGKALSDLDHIQPTDELIKAWKRGAETHLLSLGLSVPDGAAG